METKTKNNNEDINIAYLLLCHEDSKLLKRLAKILLYKKDKIFVHVDKKVDITNFKKAVKGLENVFFIENRCDISWGGFNSIVATMALIKAMLNDNIKYDRFILLQGKDYPLYSPKDIHSFFNERRDEEFCKAVNITKSKNPVDYMKCCGRWYLDWNRNIFQKVVRKFFAFLNTKVCIKYRKGYFMFNKNRWDVFKGWAQISLTRDCALFVLSIYENTPKYNQFMKRRFPQDEIYIHTIIYNSNFKNKVTNYSLVPRKNAEWFSNELNLTYFEYPKQVSVFKNASDYVELLKTKALFVRKLTSVDSTQLLDTIDSSINEL